MAELDKFIPARELKVGSKLLLSSGKCVTIEEIQVEQLSESETTYNFEVADFHTYYISESNILVHNKCWEWGKGSYDSPELSLKDHAKRHGKKLGIDPTDTATYYKKATNFADMVIERKVKAGKWIEGVTPNIRRYKYLGKYIDMDKINKIIVSFGVIG